MRYDKENIKHNNSMYTKSFTYCDFGGIIQSMTHSFKSIASLACRKYRLDNAFITGRQKKWVIATVGGKQTHKNNHFMYLPKQNSAFGFCFTDASLTYKQVQSKAK